MKSRYRASKAKQGYLSKDNYTFANVLNSRNVVATSNIAWVMDLTTIKTQLQGHPNSKHIVLVIMDLFCRKVIYNKVFLLPEGKGCISAAKVIKALKQCALERNIFNKVLIHTDNGTEFINKQYHSFIQEHPFFIGSTCYVGHCEHNAVIESFFNVIKNTIKTKVSKLKENIEIPDSVATTQHCQTIFNRRMKFYNEEYKGFFNKSLTSAEKEKKAQQLDLVLPEVLF